MHLKQIFDNKFSCLVAELYVEIHYSCNVDLFKAILNTIDQYYFLQVSVETSTESETTISRLMSTNITGSF